MLTSNFGESVGIMGTELCTLLAGIGFTKGPGGNNEGNSVMSKLDTLCESLAAPHSANEARFTKIERKLQLTTAPAPNWATESYAAQAAAPATSTRPAAFQPKPTTPTPPKPASKCE